MMTNDTDQPRGAAKKEAFHRAAEERIVPFSFVRPDTERYDDRTICYLAHSDLIEGSVQVFPKGGGNALHYHPGTDGFWMVLKGRMRFHGPDGAIGEYGPHEGLLMPRNARYWFESADLNEEAWLLHLNCESQDNVQNRSVTLGPRDPDRKKNMHFGFPPGLRASG